MKIFTSKQKIQYYFEQTNSKGPTSSIKWLAIISLFFVFILGLIISIFGVSSNTTSNQELGFIEGSWQSLMATLDSGTMGGE